MNFRLAALRAATVLCTAGSLLADSPADDAPASRTPPSPALLEAWGRILAHESEADAFALGAAEQTAFVRGLVLGASRQPAPQALDAIYGDVTHFVEEHRAALRDRQRARNLAAAPAYFAQLAKQPGVTLRPSGLAYQILRPGDGAKPTPADTVNVAYRARLIDGTEFDSTEQMGPIDLALRTTVPGWTEGLQLIGIGGKIRLWLPPPLAFSDEDAVRLGIPPASVVVSELELFAIKPTPPTEPAPPPAPAPPLPPPSRFAVTEIIETWGWVCAQERGLMQAGLNDAERALVARGAADALAGRASDIDEHALYPDVAHFVAARREAYQEAIRQRRRAETVDFFAGLARRPEVVRLPDGLCYEIVRPGHGAPPRADQWVRVNYTGRLIDGTIFDRTDPELGPLEIDLAHVIRGWTEGMQKIAPGGLIRLYLPPALAYGDAATGGIPADSTLCFEIELLEVRDPPATETPATQTAPRPAGDPPAPAQ